MTVFSFGQSVFVIRDVKYVSLEQKENHVNNAAEFSEVVALVFFFFKKK